MKHFTSINWSCHNENRAKQFSFECSKLFQLSSIAEGYFRCLVHVLCFKGNWPTVKGLVFKSNMASYEKSKNVQYRMNESEGKIGYKINNTRI